MNKVIRLEHCLLWCNKRLNDCKDPFGPLEGKGILYRQGYKTAIEDIMTWMQLWVEEIKIPSEYIVDIRDIQKKFDDAAKDENLAPITRLAIGAAKEIVLNNGIAGPIA